ncbi:MAG: single-stranded DNA-binding protein [Firmicutes bacterium]|nr:single-stranded DNA-binding protein [Bacillota bacterium]
MLNQVVLVGRLAQDLQLNKTDNGKKVSTLTLAVPRSFKNMEGEYETDFIRCVLWDSVAENTKEYCKKGDVVGVKGRVQSRVVEKDNKKETILEIIGEKVTFLSSKKEEKAD